MKQIAPLTGEHDHVFGQDRVTRGERRTIIVVVVTVLMMVVEIAAGIVFGSMALLADGLHMGSHAAALGVAAFAYLYARRRAGDPRYSFGTGKVNALAGFAGAVLLAVFALLMAFESTHRLLKPVTISFDQAILVAVLGLVVNGVCAFILGNGHDHEGEHEHHGHEEGHDEHDHGHHHHHHDHNLRSAYLHVMADALTSVTAILALLAGKYLGWNWMDPTMGIVGSLLVARWSVGLLRSASAVLLDRQAPEAMLQEIRRKLESEKGVRVADLHVWSIGPGIYAAEIVLAVDDPRPANHYKAVVQSVQLSHVTVEVQPAEKGARGVEAEVIDAG